jgi:hypothetical protein
MKRLLVGLWSALTMWQPAHAAFPDMPITLVVAIAPE